MPDYTDREIPVLDDIISSPVKTDELLADVKIDDEPDIPLNVQLDIGLDEHIDTNTPSFNINSETASLVSTQTVDASPYNELSQPSHQDIASTVNNNTPSGTRIEPGLHSPVLQDIEHTVHAAEISNTDSFQQQTNEYDDPGIVSSGERLYRYIPETNVNHPKNQVTDETHRESRPIDLNITENKQAKYLPPDDEAEYLEATHLTSNTTTSEHIDYEEDDEEEAESALIDYQVNIDPYAMDEAVDESVNDAANETMNGAIEESMGVTMSEAVVADNSAATDNLDDKNWQDIQQEISDIQAETSPANTDRQILSILNKLDTEALTEQLLLDMLPNIEQQLRLHIKDAIDQALNASMKKMKPSCNDGDSPTPI